MITRSLPFEGYSWGLSQHAAGFDQKTISGMLTCALPFVGSINYQDSITSLMAEADILTTNIRDGKADSWRDYQQILAELGLTVSAKLVRNLTLTNVAQLFVAGELSFQNLMLMQVMRYQYPNGQKHDISPRLKRDLANLSKSIPDSLIELHQLNGVLIKPGTLILRVLLELELRGIQPRISANECRSILLPCKTNNDWEEAIHAILSSRNSNENFSGNHHHARRNIQDWFKLLKSTSVFDTDGSSFVELSASAIEQKQTLMLLCDEEAKPENFWLPKGTSVTDRLSWFQHYGAYQISYDILGGTTSEVDLTVMPDATLKENERDEIARKISKIKFEKFNVENLFSKLEPSLSNDITELAQRFKSGAIMRHAKTLLHDEIVKKYARRFEANGAEVLVDSNSIDLFVKWSEDQRAIFEVKTVSQASLPNRLRLAIGQIKEYGYRLHREQNIDADQVIIIDRTIKPQSWQRDFLNDYLDVGLLCSVGEKETIFPSKSDTTSSNWSP